MRQNEVVHRNKDEAASSLGQRLFITSIKYVSFCQAQDWTYKGRKVERTQHWNLVTGRLFHLGAGWLWTGYLDSPSFFLREQHLGHRVVVRIIWDRIRQSNLEYRPWSWAGTRPGQKSSSRSCFYCYRKNDQIALGSRNKFGLQEKTGDEVNPSLPLRQILRVGPWRPSKTSPFTRSWNLVL